MAVILTIYNLSLWLMQKRKYLLLTILISGPVQPGVDMDVFLEPLMEEMKMLWIQGVEMVDEYLKGVDMDAIISTGGGQCQPPVEMPRI